MSRGGGGGEREGGGEVGARAVVTVPEVQTGLGTATFGEAAVTHVRLSTGAGSDRPDSTICAPRQRWLVGIIRSRFGPRGAGGPVTSE